MLGGKLLVENFIGLLIFVLNPVSAARSTYRSAAERHKTRAQTKSDFIIIDGHRVRTTHRRPDRMPIHYFIDSESEELVHVIIGCENEFIPTSEYAFRV